MNKVIYAYKIRIIEEIMQGDLKTTACIVVHFLTIFWWILLGLSFQKSVSTYSNDAITLFETLATWELCPTYLPI